ncbi:AAWKG family protein [Streptomyces sp. NPDC006733]|uniref:AAWKG family protein n=1 Tax=Streptomyces sp. NPDC006733 TaxID=3155460 RepID=UPI0033EBDDD0
MADPKDNNNDNWKAAVDMLTGYILPPRDKLFEKLKGNDGIPMMHVRLDHVSDSYTSGFVSSGGWHTKNTDYTIPYLYTSGDVSDGTQLSQYRAHITFLASSQAAPPGGYDIIPGYTKTSDKLKDKGGWNKEGEKLDWDTNDLVRYLYGAKAALDQLLLWPHSTHGFENRGISVNDEAYVDLGSFTEVAKAFDRAVKFFEDSALTVGKWDTEDIGEGSDAWDGTSAAIFKELIHKLARNYEGYADQLKGEGAEGTSMTIDGTVVRSQPARALADAQQSLLTQANNLALAYNAWRPESNPQRWLYDMLQDARLNVIDTQFDKSDFEMAGGEAYDLVIVAKPGFDKNLYIGDTSYGSPSEMETWKKIGDEAVRRWENSVQEWLSVAGADAIVAIAEAFATAQDAFDTDITDKDKRALSEIAAKEQTDKEKKEAAEEKRKAKEEADKAKKEADEERRKAKEEADKEKAEAKAEHEKEKAEAAKERAEAKAEAEKEKAEAKAEHEKEKEEAQKEKEEAKAEAAKEKAEAKAEQRTAKEEADKEREQAKAKAEQEKAQAKEEQAAEKKEAQKEKAEATSEATKEKDEAKAEAAKEKEEAEQQAEQQRAFAVAQAERQRADAKKEKDEAKAEADAEKAAAKEEHAAEKTAAEKEKEEAKTEAVAEKAAAKEEQEAAKEEARKEKEEAKAENAQQRAEAEQAQEEAKAHAVAEKATAKQEQDAAKAQAEGEKAAAKQEQTDAKAEARHQQEQARQEAVQEKQQARLDAEQAKSDAQAEYEQQKADAREERAAGEQDADRRETAAKQEFEQHKSDAQAERDHARQQAEQDRTEARREYDREIAGGTDEQTARDAYDRRIADINATEHQAVQQADHDASQARHDYEEQKAAAQEERQQARADAEQARRDAKSTYDRRMGDIQAEYDRIGAGDKDIDELIRQRIADLPQPPDLSSYLPSGPGSTGVPEYSSAFSDNLYNQDDLASALGRPQSSDASATSSAGSAGGPGAPMMPQMMRGAGGDSGSSGERVRNVIEPGTGRTGRAGGPVRTIDAEEHQVIPRSTQTSSSTPFMPPMGGMPGAGGPGRQTESSDRERTTWLAEDEDVWGTEEGGTPQALGR